MFFNKLIYEKNSNKVWKTRKKSEYTNKIGKLIYRGYEI